MAPSLYEYSPERSGDLKIKNTSPHHVEVYFVPPKNRIEEAGLTQDRINNYETKLLDIDCESKFLTIYPIVPFGDKTKFLKQKYEKVQKITFESFQENYFSLPNNTYDVISILEGLPKVFTKDFAYGLGFLQKYRFILSAVETLSDCNEIIISKKHVTGLDQQNDRVFYISKKDLEDIRLAINRIDNSASVALNSVNEVTVYNILSKPFNVPELKPKIGRSFYRKAFTAIAEGKEEFSEKDQNDLIMALSKNVENIAKEQPIKIAKLRTELELATLETLIDRYESMLDKVHKEADWQIFFNENPFILSMAFGYPIIKVCDQASVGGRKISGNGEKITDFLVKHSLTNNVAIFEIKTPKTEVLQKTNFRNGVFAPSSELSGSINQVLDQKYQLQKQITQIKDNTRLYDIESYAVHCCLVIGKIPNEDDKKKSFELFRRNSKDVEIITFDELLEKLKRLSAFLKEEVKIHD